MSNTKESKIYFINKFMMKMWNIKILKASDGFFNIPRVIVLENNLMDFIRELCYG